MPPEERALALRDPEPRLIVVTPDMIEIPASSLDMRLLMEMVMRECEIPDDAWYTLTGGSPDSGYALR